MSSIGESVHRLVNDVPNDALPAPPDSVATWPVIGELSCAGEKGREPLAGLARKRWRR